MVDKTLNRSDLVQQLAHDHQLTPQVAERLAKTILDCMIHSLGRHHRIEIRGFGSFDFKIREARDARNPKTGKPIHTPRHHVVHFKPGKGLRERIDP